MKTALFRTLPALALLATAGAAFAQPSPATPAGAANNSGPTSSQPQAQMATRAAAAQPDARLEAHIKRLHEKLGITSAEETAWQGLVQAMRQNAESVRQEYAQRTQQMSNMTALDDMRSYASMAQARAAEAQKMLAAFQPLYDQMSPEQKAKADQVFRAQAEHRAEHAREMHNQRS
jgi:hypothetical protein